MTQKTVITLVLAVFAMCTMTLCSLLGIEIPFNLTAEFSLGNGGA